MRTVQLYPEHHGQVALVDDVDFERISKHRWTAFRQKHPDGSTRGWYAVRNVRSGGKSKLHMMHRVILGADGETFVDHVNGNGIDNRRCNLRLCTVSQNAHNMAPLLRGSSPYKGVTWHKTEGRWAAQIKSHGRHIHLGLYDDEVAAAHIYDRAARSLFGEFARANFEHDDPSVTDSRRVPASKLRGVTIPKPERPSPWVASIRINGKSVYLGAYRTEQEAAMAYDAAALAAHGERARLNFPNQIAGGKRLRGER